MAVGRLAVLAAVAVCLGTGSALAGAAEPPPLRFEGFDTTTAYPGLACEVRPVIWDGRWPQACELVSQTGGVAPDPVRRLLVWTPETEGQAATFEVRASDASGTSETRRGRVACTRSGFYFVDQGAGADDGPGTEARPWKTIAKAAATLKAGETVLVRAGRYVEPEGPHGKGNWAMPTLTPQHSGEPGRPITFRAYPGETVVVDSTIGTSGGRNYIVWEGFVLPYGAVAKMFGTEGSVLRGIYLHGHTAATRDNHDGIRIQHARRFMVQDCHIRNMRGLSWNSAGIKVYKECTGVVEHCNLSGSHVNVFDKDSSRGIDYRRNVFDRGNFLGNNQGVAQGLRIYENLFLRCGINLHCYTADAHIWNNTLYGGGISGHHAARAAGVRCWNNIFWGIDTGFRPEVCDHNVYFHPDAEPFAKGPPFRLFRYLEHEERYASLQAWREATGLDAHSLAADPGFVDAAGGDFRLKPGSPALAAGKDGRHVGALATDGPPLGVRRPWRDRGPIPEEEAKTEAAMRLLDEARKTRP